MAARGHKISYPGQVHISDTPQCEPEATRRNLSAWKLEIGT
jgi:hypothetical protein